MPSNNSNVTPIRLASDVATWREMHQTIDDCITRILGQFDEGTTRDFMFIVDCLTNPDIDRVDRECATFSVQKLAFAHSPRFESELEKYLNEINPGRIQRRTRRQVRA